MSDECVSSNNKIGILYNIGFIRILFTSIILIFHLVWQPNTLFANYPEIYNKLHLSSSFGYLGVEMFFIMAGFFLFYSIPKYNSVKEFFVHKWIRLWFVPVFAIFSIWILSLLGISAYNKYANILHLLLLKNTGLTLCLADNGTTWFISVLFWVSLFYFYIAKIFEKKYLNLIIALAIYYSLVVLVNSTQGHFEEHYEMVNSIFNVGMLRGIAEIGIGYFIGFWYEDAILNRCETNCKFKIFSIEFLIYSLAEIYLLIFIVQRLLFKAANYTNDLVLVIIFIAFYMLFLRKRGILSIVTNNRVIYNLGKYAFSIYVMQEVVYRILAKTLWLHSIRQEQAIVMLLISFIITVVVGIATYHIIEYPALSLCKKFIKLGGRND